MDTTNPLKDDFSIKGRELVTAVSCRISTL